MPTYIQYGCGQSCPPGWDNYDVSLTLRLQRLPLIGSLFKRGKTVFPDGVRFGDIVAGLPVADGSVDGVYASHVLDSLTYEDFWIALRNTHRILKPGGVFRFVVIDLKTRAQMYLSRLEQGSTDANTWFLDASSMGLKRRNRGPEALLRAAFGQSGKSWAWDEPSLRAALQKSGFGNIRRCAFNDAADPQFNLAEESWRFYDGNHQIEELAMEAKKPA